MTLSEFSLESLLAGLRATSGTEWAATAAGLTYIVLIIRRSRWGWVAGGISSSLFVVVFMRSALPMQALLQGFYVLAAIYGWWSWAPGSQPERVSTWTLRGHLLAVAACVLVSLGLAKLLAGESAYPLIDSLLACAGLCATWLVTRVYLENWIYWIVIDVVSIWLFLSQGLLPTACLFVVYTVMATVGLRSWWRLRREQILRRDQQAA